MDSDWFRLFFFRAMFAPACLSHEVITRKWVWLNFQTSLSSVSLSGDTELCVWDFPSVSWQRPLVLRSSYWIDVQVKGTSLPRALHCWDRSLHDNRNNKAPPKGCPVHLIDSCPWPHCNPTCPTIRDQFTGQEMNVIQFLMHMGFDVQKMAQQQGMDPSKLLGMLSSGS